MTFEQWVEKVEETFTLIAGIDGAGYVEDTGLGAWREMYEEGLSPDDAVEEEMSNWHG